MMNSEPNINKLDDEDIEFATLGDTILSQLGKDNSYLASLGEYLDLAQQQARVAILYPVLEEIIKAGFPPDELLFGVAAFSYRWGCQEATTKIEDASTAVAIFLREKAAKESTQSRPE